MDSIKQSKLVPLVSNAFTVGIIAWLIVKWSAGDGIKSAFNDAKPIWFAGAVLCLLAFLVCDAVVFHILTLKINNKADFKRSLYATLIGRFYFNTTPLGVPIQIKLVSDNGISGAEATSVYIQKSKLFQIIMVLYAVAGFIYQFTSAHSREFLWIAALIIGFNSFIIILYTLFSVMPQRFIALGRVIISLFSKIKFIKEKEKICNTLENYMLVFFEQLLLFKNQWKSNLISFLLIIVQLFGLFSVTYFIYRAFGNTGENIFGVILLQAVAYAFASLIFLPGNAGGSEGGFYLFCAPLFHSEQIVPAIVLWRFVTYFLVVIIGAAAIFEKRISMKRKLNIKKN